MRLGPDVLLLSAKQNPFTAPVMQVDKRPFLMVTVVTDMGERLIEAQSYSARTLAQVCIMRPSCIICQECVSEKCNC